MQTSLGAEYTQTRSNQRRIDLQMATPDSTIKQCSKCKEVYSRTIEFFPPRKDSKDGLRGYCRKCETADDANRYLENKEVFIQRSAKRYKEKREQILADYRMKYQENPEKYREKSLNYHHNHRDTSLATMRRSWARNKEKRNAEQRQYRLDNPEKFRISVATARARSPDLYRRIRKAITHRYRARKAGLPNTLTSQEWQHALDYFKNSCAVCGRKVEDVNKIEADHWIPLSSPLCPGTVASNMIPLCDKKGGCNQSKGNKAALGWLINRYGEDEARAIFDRVEGYFRSLTE